MASKVKHLFTCALILVAWIYESNGLECGISNGLDKREFKRLYDKCMPQQQKNNYGKSNEESSSSQDSEDLSENNSHNQHNSKSNNYNNYHQQNRNTGNNGQVYENIKKEDNHRQIDYGISDNSSNKTGIYNTNSEHRCIVHCIFSQLGVTDESGMPSHHLVLQTLMKSTQGRELRDFIQDSVDQCFQLMGQMGNHPDSCDYSVNLINCLAEKGSANCADWPVGNLPF